MVGPKMQDFAQESTCSKEIFFKQSCDELLFVKKCRNRNFKVNFYVKNRKNFFKKKFIYEYQFRRQFLVKNFFF